MDREWVKGDVLRVKGTGTRMDGCLVTFSHYCSEPRADEPVVNVIGQLPGLLSTSNSGSKRYFELAQEAVLSNE